jgi:LacI family transcriptional regulator, galactose operon repressor
LSDRRQVRIADLAREAGVSKATVSRALNGRGDVDAGTRERVLGVAGRLGYVPSAAARALTNGRSDCLGLLVPSLTWPWLLELLRGVADAVERSGYSLMLHTTMNGEESERRFVSRVAPARIVDGLALIVPPGLVDEVGQLVAAGLPVVVIDDRAWYPEYPSVATTNEEGALAAVRHLVGTGRRRIATIAGPPGFGCSGERLAGYRRALEEAGLAFDASLVVAGRFNEASGVTATRRLLEVEPSLDAIFAANDEMALGALQALRAAGRRLPEDVAVVGFDDIPAAASSTPSLTTVHQPMFEMGQAAVAMLIAAIESRPYTPHITLPTTLIPRDSTATRS